ncbi:transcriptional regulator, TetR family [Lentibacillus halodurans]|uniref:Transcriptional regulator, TetR family n=2 Tax=Lentibacillus halodurans TaxID=237679 RepID=A0A1I0Y226_9BACI|nr:transcriptional regulator, TetR family [Lentibacillus halodurans]
MLFYYFQSKKELYHYLIERSLNTTIVEYLGLIDTNERDFIERMKQILSVKMKSMAENPNVFHFLGMFFLENEPELPSHLRRLYDQLLEEGYSIMYHNIDKSLFRDDVNVDKLFNLIKWVMDGYQNEVVNRLKGQNLASVDFDPYWDEFFEYLDILKKTFYR